MSASFNSPSVSVIMPVFNVSPYVERCLLSVMHQTFPAKECIIVDDGSTDDSVTRCQRLIDDYSGPTKFVILHHSKNRGLSAARNTGINAAIATFIYFVDSDDEMTEDCLEKIVCPVMHDNTIEMVLGSYRNDYSEMEGIKNWIVSKINRYVKRTPQELRTNEEVRRWYYHNIFPRPDQVWNKLLSLSFVKENQLYNREGQLYEDVLWSYYLIGCLKHAVVISNVTYVYYCRPGSIITDTKYQEKIRQHGRIFKEIADHVISGERIEVTERWLPDFCLCYVDAYNNPDYQHVYHVFRQQLSSRRCRLTYWQLLITHYLRMNRIGRVSVKAAIRLRLMVRKVISC